MHVQKTTFRIPDADRICANPKCTKKFTAVARLQKYCGRVCQKRHQTDRKLIVKKK